MQHQLQNQKIKGGRIIVDESSLSHTRWKCQYHIVLVPKYRRKVVYGKLRKDIGAILRWLCDYKHVRRNGNSAVECFEFVALCFVPFDLFFAYAVVIAILIFRMCVHKVNIKNDFPVI